MVAIRLHYIYNIKGAKVSHLITHIKTKNFMGEDIDEDIGPKTIYTGPNTAGKTKRSKAIALCLLGFIPFSAKTNKIGADILNDCGNGEHMSTSITCGGKVFERIFKKSKSGAVKKSHKIDGKQASKSVFEIGLVKAGDPRIVDLNHFISLSDNNRIDALFALYPPDGDLSTINTDIEKSRAEISRLSEEKSKADNTILALIESKGDIELPAGSLAETREAIKTLTQEILDSRESLKEIEIKDASNEAVENEKINAKAEIKKTQAALDKTMSDNTVSFEPSNDVEKQEQFKAQDPENQRVHDFASGKDVSKYDNHTHSNDTENYKEPYNHDGHGGRYEKLDRENSSKNKTVRVSIQKIIDIMEDSGCSICAGLMVAKVEIRKYR